MARNRWEKEREKNSLILQIIRIANRLQAFGDNFFRSHGVTSAQYNVLVLLRANPQGLTQVEISRQMIVSRANITVLVDRLERLGFVRRIRGQDRRAFTVVITQQGLEFIDKVEADYFAQVDKIFPDEVFASLSSLKAGFSYWERYLVRGEEE